MKDDYDSRNEGMITFSKLQCFLTTPLYFKLRFIDKVIPAQPQSEPLLIGSAFDAWIQGRDVFDAAFEVVEQRVDIERRIESLRRKVSEAEAEIVAFSSDPTDRRAAGKIETRRRYLEEYAAEIVDLSSRAGKSQVNENQFELILAMERELQRQKLFSFDQDQAQVLLEAEYRGHKIRGTADQLRKDEKMIRDLKTCAAIDGLFRSAQLRDEGGQTQYIEKYLDQLTFYQWLHELQSGESFGGIIDAVTKESPPRSEFFMATPEQLLANRPKVLGQLDQLIDAIESDIWPVPDRRTLMRTPAYGFSAFDIQSSFTTLTP